MNVQIILTMLISLWLGACIAGPTPHPAQDSGSDPNMAGQMDASLGTVDENYDGQETNPPTDDAENVPDAMEDVPEEDIGTDDSVDDDMTEEEDVVPDDSATDETLQVDAD